MSSTRIRVHMKAPRSRVYRALLDMTITITLSDEEQGTALVAVHDRLPAGLSPEDNETGWRSSLAKLAALLEGDGESDSPR